MLEMAIDSTKLLFAGKLFKDNRKVVFQFATGSVLGAAAGLAVGQVAPIWLGAMTAGGVAGAMIPFLLRHVKYA